MVMGYYERQQQRDEEMKIRKDHIARLLGQISVGVTTVTYWSACKNRQVTRPVTEVLYEQIRGLRGGNSFHLNLSNCRDESDPYQDWSIGQLLNGLHDQDKITDKECLGMLQVLVSCLGELETKIEPVLAVAR